MPGRNVPLITGQIYHIFNRGIDRRPTFTDIREYRRMLLTLDYYRFAQPPIRLSMLLQLEESRKNEILESLITNPTLVDVIAFCLMPNHFHLLLEQKADSGISKYLSKLQNSYTKYFNTKHKRDGALFLDQFKAVRVETDEQLIHVSRYIHLNPFTAYLLSSLNQLKSYQYSSLPAYLNQTDENFIKKSLILDSFSKPSQYEQFIFNQASYQRQLKAIEHLALE